MGSELAPWTEWNHERELEWGLLAHAKHAQVQALVDALNALYRDRTALHARDHDPSGFEWIDLPGSRQQRARVPPPRRRRDGARSCSTSRRFPRTATRSALPIAGRWNEILNTDALELGGSGVGNLGGCRTRSTCRTTAGPRRSRSPLPPLGAVYLEPSRE
jgi:1,4-alpha-glucan branching enzyme